MNPGAASLLHSNSEAEVYMITKGDGLLIWGLNSLSVRPGSVVVLPAGVFHRLFNIGLTSLEHLVLTHPPFNAAGVNLAQDQSDRWPVEVLPARIPPVTDAFDGAKIASYELSELDLSIAYGWVSNDPARRKQPHYHRRRDEFIYIVEGKGSVQVGIAEDPVEPGDWIHVEPPTEHAIRNKNDEHLVVVCICSPAFDPNDVGYMTP
jgi:mannose-6-phosphate isomerase-like protein (cupin superfamily)